MAFDPTGAYLEDEEEQQSSALGLRKAAAQPSKPFDPVGATLDEDADQGVTGTLWQGTKSAARAIGATGNTYTGNGEAVVEKAQAQQEAPKDYRLEGFYKDVQQNSEATRQETGEEPGLLDSIGNVGKAVIDNPAGAGLAVLEQLPNAAPTLAGGWAGMKLGATAGAAAGAPFAGVGAGPGAAIGGVVGGLAGMFLGNAAIETGHKAMGAAEDGEFTADEQSQVKREGAIKGGVITAIDGLTLGLGGKLASSMQRTATSALESATRKTLVDHGIDVADEAAVLAARQSPEISAAVRAAQDGALKATDTFKRRALEAGTLLGLETVGEGMGEYLGELAATGKADITGAVMEAAMSLGQSGIESAWNMSRTRQDRGQWAPAEQIQPMPSEGNPAPAPIPRLDPNAGPLSAAANLLPAPEDNGTLYGDPAGNLSGSRPAWVNPENDLGRQSFGPGMDQPGPLGSIVPQGATIEGEFARVPASSQTALPDLRQDAVVVDSQGNSRSGKLPNTPPASYVQGGRGMDQQTPIGARYSNQLAAKHAISKAGDPSALEVVAVGPKQFEVRTKAHGLTGESIDGNWHRFAPQSGSLAVPREQMPQIKAEHRGAMVNFLNARGVAHEEQTVPAGTLKPAQAEFSREKVERAKGFAGGNRAILTSADGYVVDGHHQWLAAVEKGEDVRTIRLAAPISELLPLVAELPSATQDKASDAPVLQNRDRSTPASITQMREIAARPDYSRLGFSRDFANGAPVVEPGAHVPAERLGRKDVATTGSGRQIPVQYAAVEAASLMPSHDVNGSPDQHYAAGMKGKSRAIAGNGRVAGLRQAFAQGTANQYVEQLAGDAGLHGITPDTIRGMKEPVLVRIMPREEITQDIGDESNTTGVSALSGAEQAMNDARRISIDDMEFSATGEISEATVRQFVQSMPKAEQGGLLDGSRPSRQAYDRAESAIFANAYESESLIRLQAQATDPEVRTVLSGLLMAAPKMARLKGAGAWDIRGLVVEAAEAAVNARRNGQTLEQFAQQIDLDRNPESQFFIELFASNIRSAKRIGDELSAVAELFYAEASKADTDMFGAVPRRSRQELLNGAANDDTDRTPADAQAAGNQAGPGTATPSSETRASERAEPAGAGAAAQPGAQGEVTAADFDLSSYSEEELAAQASARAEADAKAAAETKAAAGKAQADLDRNDFTLSGSDRPADVAASRGQNDMFAQPTRGEKKAQQAQAVSTQDLAKADELERQANDAYLRYHNGSRDDQGVLRRLSRDEALQTELDRLEWAKLMLEANRLRGEDVSIQESNYKLQKERFEEQKLISQQPSMEDSPDGWRSNLMKARQYANQIGVPHKGKTLEQLVAEIDGYQQAEEGGKPQGVADQLASMNIDELSALIDEISEQEAAPQTSKPKAKRSSKGKTTSGKPRVRATTSKAERTDTAKPDEVSRAAGEIAKSLGVNMSSAGMNALEGLSKLFGGPGRLNSGLSFDEETYAKAKPYFAAAMADIQAAGKDLRDFIRALLGQFGDGVKPYIMRYAQDLKQEQTSGRTNQGLEPDRTANAEQGAGRDLRADQPGEDGRRAEQLGQGQGGQRADDSAGVPGSGPVAGGERGDSQVDGAQSGLAGRDAGSADAGRGGPDSTGGLYAERAADPAADRAIAQSVKAPAKANLKPSSRPGTLAEIKEQMPFLTDGQAEDVVFAEKRLSKPDGYGVLYTNGTGTGKTFSGLGIAARQAANGKTNILIVAPKQPIVDAWVKAGKSFFGLDIKPLESMQDNGGSGIVATTFANLGGNNSLALREWDLVIADEAQYLSSDMAGSVTQALSNLRALTRRRGTSRSLVNMREADKVARMQALYASIESNKREALASGSNHTYEQDKKDQAEADLLRAELDELYAQEEAANAALPPAQKPRAVFLSATPFAYEKNVVWAQEFLFDWGTDDGSSQAYNAGGPYERFMIQHFGYRMRYNKLNEPDAKVDRGLMQRAFNSWLKREGALSGRALDSEYDYDRLFVTVDSPIGRRVDEALKWLRDMTATKDANGNELHASEEEREAYNNLHDRIAKGSFDYHARMYFLEAIKAREALPHIRAHLDAGRKVLVMHDFKKGGAVNPFRQSFAEEADQAAYEVFRAEFPDLIRAFDVLPSPIDQLSRAFPDALIYNGSYSAKKRVAMQDAFNSDDDGAPRLMIAQGDAMREGVSIHDTTGKASRTMIHLGMPVKPTSAIQQEGRTYRTGQASNAMFRYFTIGTAWERSAFAGKIATRASAAENLAMGEQARGLKQAFIDAYENADLYEPGFAGEGTGGKAADRAAAAALTPWDMAKSFYFGTKKQGQGRSARGREGNDYFATPEPVGLKMVEWADIRGGESVLEPSAGHGAIARWFPDGAKVRVIEQSAELASRAALHVDGEVVHGNFEDHHIVNKYDAIVMNPPYGLGGAVAVPHLMKAADHLREGGRVVALMPTGPAADKRFDSWLYALDKNGNAQHPDLHLVGDVLMPSVTFERAGTGVRTRLVIIEKVGKDMAGQVMPTRQADLTDIEDIGELFDRMESMEMRARVKPVEEETEQTAPAKSVREATPKRNYAEIKAEQTGKYTTDAPIIEHTTGKGKLLRGVIVRDMTLDEVKAKYNEYAFKKDGGVFLREEFVQRPAENGATIAGEALYSLNPETRAVYEARIDELFAGAEPNNTAGVRVLDRSDVLDMLGYGDREVVLAEKHAVSDGRFNHPQFTAADWKKVPEWLENPVAVFQRDDGHLVVVAPETKGGEPIIIGVNPDARQAGYAGGKRLHVVLTAYNKDRGRLPIERMVRDGQLRYVDTRKSPAFNDSSGHRLPGNVVELRGLGKKVYTGADLFKYRSASSATDGQRLRVSPGKAKGIPLFSARAIADKISQATGLQVEPVADEAGLPAAVRAQIRSDGVSGRVAGVYHDGTSYLIASNLRDSQHAISVVLHEAVGHGGVKAVLGDKLGIAMRGIYRGMPAAMRAELERRYAGQLAGLKSDSEREVLIAEEYVAHLAEHDPSNSVLDRIVALVKQFIRKLFGEQAAGKWSRADVVQLLAEAKRAAGSRGASDRGSRYRAAEAADALAALPEVAEADEAEFVASLTGDSGHRAFAGAIYKARGTASPFFQRWFGKSRMVDKQGQPIAFVHRSFGEKTSFDDTRLGGSTGTATAALGHFLARNDVGNVERYGPVVDQFYIRMVKPKVVTQAQFEAMGDWSLEQVKAYRKTLMGQGHDGLYILGLAWPVVFEGKNIKARRNSGAFDESANVRYGLADDATEEALRKFGFGDKETDTLASQIRNMTWAGMKAKIGEMATRSEEGLFDGLVGIKRAEEAVGVNDPNKQGYVSARLASGLADVIHGVFHYGSPEWRDGIVQRKADTRGVLEILGELGQENLTPWLAWVGAKRAQMLKAEGRENNLSDQDITELLAMASGKEQLFERVYREYAAINEAVLDLAEGAGLINPEAREKWATEYYVPFYRQSEADGIFTGPRTKRGLSHQTAAIKQLKGGNVPTNDLLVNILSGWTKRIDASLKNKALLETVDNLKGSDYLTDEGMKWTRLVVPRAEVVKKIKGDRVALEYWAEQLGLDETAGHLEIAHELNKLNDKGYEELWGQVAPQDPDIIRVQRNGKNEFYRVNDESLLRGLKFIEGSTFNDPITRIGRAFKRVLTTGVTASPDFILRNFIRDAASAWMINKDGFTLGKDSIKGMRDAFKEDADYRDLMFAGASFQGGYIHGGDPEASADMIRRALAKKGMSRSQQAAYMSSLVNTPAKAGAMMQTAWEKYRAFGDKVENANRLSTYKAALAAGKSKRQSAYEAKDLMDFSLRGNFAAAQWFTDVVPFLNARAQGLYKLGRAMKGDKTLIAKEVAMKGAYLALFSLLLASANGDDERYKALKDWDKDANWHFWFSDDQVEPFRIPKPFELGLIFGTVPERLLHAMTSNQDGGDLAKAVAHGVFQTLAFNPVPQFYQPIREVQANRNFFFDMPIEDMSDEGKLPEARYDERTSAIGRGLGQLTGPALGVSPKQLDHLVRGYTGTLGGYVLSMSNVIAGIGSDAARPAPTAGDIPVVKVLYAGDGVKSTQYQTEFYDMMEEAEQLHRTAQAFREEGKVEEARELIEENRDKLKHRPALGFARKQLGNVRNQMDAVYRDTTMDATAKRVKLDALQERANAIAKRVTELAGEDF